MHALFVERVLKMRKTTILLYLCVLFAIVSGIAVFQEAANAAVKPPVVEAVRAIQNRNDIVWADGGPIKLISPYGAVLLTNANQKITDSEKIQTGGKRYPFFILDLNDLNEGSEQWIGVELKASTNNFGLSGGSNSPLYWFSSETTSTNHDGEVAQMDGSYAFGTYMGGDTSKEVRGWYRIKTSMEDLMYPGFSNEYWPRKIGILVVPDLFKHTTDTSWCNESNQEIVWIYMRVGANDYEINENGKGIWTMCEPVKWFDSIPSWATNGVNSVE